jgi:ADP-heptose:LPS heptosyltransferase
MNTSQMRIIDSLLGGAVCLILDALERLRRLFVRTAPPQEIRKILISKYLGMGSILLATPTLRALRNAYPESRLVFLTFESNARFAERLPLIDEVRYFRTSSFLAFAIDVCTILPELRREKFDLVLDLEFFARFSTIVSYLTRSKMRIGYYLPKLWRGELLTHLIYFNPYRHVTEVFSAQLAPLGLTVTDFSLTPPEVPACAVDGVATLLRDKGVGEDERLIVVNANASDLSTERRWPLEQFVTLVTAAAALPGHRLILVGSPEETDYVGRLHASLPVAVQQKVLNVAGNLSVDEFIALIKRVDLCITNDSGPLHIAAAQGVSTVSFFGPETPTLYGPVGPNHEIFYADLYCSPCLNVYNAKRAMCNGDNRCMQSITADMVIERLREKGIL